MGADQIVRLHRRQIEKEHQQAAVAQLIVCIASAAGVFGPSLSTGTTIGFASSAAAVSTCFDVRIRKIRDRLRLAIIGHRELIGAQAL